MKNLEVIFVISLVIILFLIYKRKRAGFLPLIDRIFRPASGVVSGISGQDIDVVEELSEPVQAYQKIKEQTEKEIEERHDECISKANSYSGSKKTDYIKSCNNTKNLQRFTHDAIIGGVEGTAGIIKDVYDHVTDDPPNLVGAFCEGMCWYCRGSITNVAKTWPCMLAQTPMCYQVGELSHAAFNDKYKDMTEAEALGYLDLPDWIDNQTKQKYAKLAVNMGAASFCGAMHGGCIVNNPECLAALTPGPCHKYCKDNVLSHDQLIKQYHPDEQEIVKETIAEVLEDGIANTDIYDGEKYLKNSAGKYCKVRYTAEMEDNDVPPTLTCKYTKADVDSTSDKRKYRFKFSAFPTGEGKFMSANGQSCYVDDNTRKIRCTYDATTDVSRYDQGTANADENDIAESAKFEITFDPATSGLVIKSKKLTNKAYCQTGEYEDKFVGCNEYKSGAETFTATNTLN